MLKRGFDLIVASVGLLLFIPLLMIISMSIKVEDRGPLFFRQKRLGIKQRKFIVLKIRTMRNNEVTKVGRWLRATGLDEIPQFINVIKGDMHIVGPRPLTSLDVDRLGWNGDRYRIRWQLAPGVTGLVQLYAGRSAGLSFYLDRKYIENSTLWLDLKIVLLSFLITIAGKRRVLNWMKLKRA